MVGMMPAFPVWHFSLKYENKQRYLLRNTVLIFLNYVRCNKLVTAQDRLPRIIAGSESQSNSLQSLDLKKRVLEI
jgi:hypothetical protein